MTSKHEQIVEHGTELLVLFPDALRRDPADLYRGLRRIEARGAAHAERLCGDAHYCNDVDHEAVGVAIINAANKLLGTDRVWLNQDPRGYALKVTLSVGEGLHTDWGGYGIIAPDFS